MDRFWNCVWKAYSNAFEAVFEVHPLNADALHEFASVAWGGGRKRTTFIYYENRDRYNALTQ